MTFSLLAGVAPEEASGSKPTTAKMQLAAIQKTFCRMEEPRFGESLQPGFGIYEGPDQQQHGIVLRGERRVNGARVCTRETVPHLRICLVPAGMELSSLALHGVEGAVVPGQALGCAGDLHLVYLCLDEQ